MVVSIVDFVYILVISRLWSVFVRFWSYMVRFLSYMVHHTKFIASVGLAQAHPNQLFTIALAISIAVEHFCSTSWVY